MKSVIWALTVIASGLFSRAAYATDFDGKWFVGNREDSSSLTVSADFYGDLGTFLFRLDEWGEDRITAYCQYYLKINDGHHHKIYLHNTKNAHICAAEGVVTISKLNPSIIAVNFPELAILPEFRMKNILEPTPPSERVVIPSNFNVLGATIGMTRREIESNLIGERKFSILKLYSRVHRIINWEYETIAYKKGSFPEAIDTITVIYSARAIGEPAQNGYAISIVRDFELGKDTELPVSNLKHAIIEKYGALDDRDTVRFSRDGALLKPDADYMTACKNEDEDISLYGLDLNRYIDLEEFCGSEVDFYISERAFQDSVERFKAELSSQEWTKASLWEEAKADLIAEATAFFNPVPNTTPAPEL